MIERVSRPAAPAAMHENSAPAATGKPDALLEAARAFEAVFLRQMIGSMRQASLGEDILGSSAADQFRDLSDARLADEMAAGKGFGIADLLVRQFQRNGGSR